MALTTRNNLIAVSAATFEKEVLKHSGAVLVDFWAQWCGPCRMLGPVLESLADKFGDRLRVAKVNVDEYPELAEAFGVQGIPALKLIVNGRLAAEWVGYRPEPILAAELERFLARAAQAAPK